MNGFPLINSSLSALTLLGKLIHHLAWNYGCCYCCSCCHSDPPPKIKRLTAVVDSIEQYRSVIVWVSLVTEPLNQLLFMSMSKNKLMEVKPGENIK